MLKTTTPSKTVRPSKNGAGKKPLIVRHGRNPKIAGTRISVFAIMDLLSIGWKPARIASFYHLNSDQVLAATKYIEDHREEVATGYQEVLDRDARGNPPELQARLDAAHKVFLKKAREYRKAKREGKIHEWDHARP